MRRDRGPGSRALRRGARGGSPCVHAPSSPCCSTAVASRRSRRPSQRPGERGVQAGVEGAVEGRGRWMGAGGACRPLHAAQPAPCGVASSAVGEVRLASPRPLLARCWGGQAAAARRGLFPGPPRGGSSRALQPGDQGAAGARPRAGSFTRCTRDLHCCGVFRERATSHVRAAARTHTASTRRSNTRQGAPSQLCLHYWDHTHTATRGRCFIAGASQSLCKRVLQSQQ